jgi:hypothetical protein
MKKIFLSILFILTTHLNYGQTEEYFVVLKPDVYVLPMAPDISCGGRSSDLGLIPFINYK